MDRDVMNKHIKLFVNNFTLNLGPEGRSAIEKLFHIAGERKIIPEIPQRIFLTTPGS
jgi:1,4-dihydroxy-6-naphthoate synthase